MTLPAFSEAGQGATAVLLLHGVGGGRAIWSDAASGTTSAIAAAGFRAVAIDFPGYGDSPGLPTLDAMVQSVLVMVAHLGAPRTVLLGHSMGGMVAQEVAARAPQAVAGLVLACTSAFFGRPTAPGRRRSSPSGWRRWTPAWAWPAWPTGWCRAWCRRRRRPRR